MRCCNGLVPTLDAGLVNEITAFATAAAVIVALATIVVSQRAAGRERRHQRLVERYQAMAGLLAAFEEIQSLRAPHYMERPWELDADNEASKMARARYVALLRASEELLVLNRAAAFRHIPYGEDPEEKAYLARAHRIGDPESEEDVIQYCRGELVNTLNALRSLVNGRPGSPPPEGYLPTSNPDSSRG